jgi:tRNA (guanine37-N1)-methyltransferase
MTFKDLLMGKIPDNLLGLVPSAFDIIGSREKSVAVIEIPDGLEKYKKEIAEAVMKKHKNVKSVLEKAGPRSGIFRIREMKLLAGNANAEVMHVESGCRFLMDPIKAYFSPREGTERLRIAGLIKPGETVMVFFAGVGPFAIIAAKKAAPAEVIGIEINPDAVRYFLENIRLNKVSNVEAVLGDVGEKAAKYHGLCDRVLMPLPEKAIEYLPDALNCLKNGGACHLYCFCDETKIREQEEFIKNAAGRHVKITNIVRVLPYGPRIWKMRFDIRCM